MNLILLFLRLLFGTPWGGSSRLLPLALRSDGRTQQHRRESWLWSWLLEFRKGLRWRLGDTSGKPADRRRKPPFGQPKSAPRGAGQPPTSTQ